MSFEIKAMTDSDQRATTGRQSIYDPIMVKAAELKPGQRFKVTLPDNFETSQEFRNSLNVSFRQRFARFNPKADHREWRLYSLANDAGIEVYRQTAEEVAARAQAKAAKGEPKAKGKGKAKG